MKAVDIAMMLFVHGLIQIPMDHMFQLVQVSFDEWKNATMLVLLDWYVMLWNLVQVNKRFSCPMTIIILSTLWMNWNVYELVFRDDFSRNPDLNLSYHYASDAAYVAAK